MPSAYEAIKNLRNVARRGVPPSNIANSLRFPTREFPRISNVTPYRIEGGNLWERSSELPPRTFKIPTNRLWAVKHGYRAGFGGVFINDLISGSFSNST